MSEIMEAIERVANRLSKLEDQLSIAIEALKEIIEATKDYAPLKSPYEIASQALKELEDK